MPNILLVEDDKIIAESIIFALENDSFKVRWCEMGNDALASLNESDFDLVLLDITLPDINGFDVLRKIRKTSEVPVIITTARGADEDIVLGLEGLGADDYVTKPFNPRVLIARMRTQLRHVDAQSTPAKETVNHSLKNIFEINKDLHQISLFNTVLNLTKAECKILSYLVDKPNQIHSKEQLLNVMHDRPSGSSEDTIITHIRSIRKAIKKVRPDDEYIKNHRGLGYSLIL